MQPQQVEMRCANEWQQHKQAHARLTRLLPTEDDAVPADGITEAFINKGAKSILKRWHKGCVHLCKPGSHWWTGPEAFDCGKGEGLSVARITQK